MSRQFMNELKKESRAGAPPSPLAKISLISHFLLLANLNMVCNSSSVEFLIFRDTHSGKKAQKSREKLSFSTYFMDSFVTNVYAYSSSCVVVDSCYCVLGHVNI